MSSPAPSAAAGPAAPVAGLARWVRGAVVGTVASAVALGGHVLGAGHAPGLLPLTGLTGTAVLVGVALSGVRWRVAPLLAVLVGAQVAFHVAFAAGHTHGVPAGHAAHLAAAPAGVSGRMLALHLVAAVATAVLLRHGEDACWQLASAVTRPVRACRRLVARPVVELHRLGAGLCEAPAMVSELLAGTAPRRGPPAPRAC
jgi:hypothetical protein